MSQPTGSPIPTSSPDDRATEFRPAPTTPMQSGETLLVEAYAVIWVIVFALLLFSWRRQKKIDARVDLLEGAIAKAREAQEKGGS